MGFPENITVSFCSERTKIFTRLANIWGCICIQHTLDSERSYKPLFWKGKVSHWKKRKKEKENWMMDWGINIVHYYLFKHLEVLNKVFLISLLWWLTSFFTLKNHSWNLRMNWFLLTIINYSTPNWRKLLIFSQLHACKIAA